MIGYLPRVDRNPAVRLALYNHKGGVGKTTLTINLAAQLAQLGYKVLLVDSDPQCNITSYLVADEVVEDLLNESNTDEGETLWSCLQRFYAGTGLPRAVVPLETPVNNLYLIPGDIQLANYEIALYGLWADCFQRIPRGLTGTAAISQIVNTICDTYRFDFVFYDCGPNVGPLNRVVLLDCDYFIIPAACDIFSVAALRTLGATLVNWIRDWRTVQSLASDELYVMPGQPKLLGYIPQRFRIYRQEIASNFARYLPRIAKRVQTDVYSVLRKMDTSLTPISASRLELGKIRDFGFLASKAQSAGVPIAELPEATDGARDVVKEFDLIAKRVIRRTASSADE